MRNTHKEQNHEEKRTGDAGRRKDRLFQEGQKTIDTVFTAIADIMAAGDKLQISGFGTFETKERAARTGHNPRTGEEINIAAATMPVFKPGKVLKDKVDGNK